MMKSYCIDVHCHLDICYDSQACIDHAQKNEVGMIITNGINSETNRKTLALASQFQEVKAALGIYPLDALKMSDQEIDQEIDFIKNHAKHIVSIGEVGLDFKEDVKEPQRQQRIFQKFIDLSLELKKPIIVHSRKAEKECIELLEKANAKKVVMHCFSGKFSLVEKIVKQDWFLSIPTSITYSEHFKNIVDKIPLQHLLCETDAPFLHPEKLKNNEPANVLTSYKSIAKIKSLSFQYIQNEIFMNVQKLFFKK